MAKKQAATKSPASTKTSSPDTKAPGSKAKPKTKAARKTSGTVDDSAAEKVAEASKSAADAKPKTKSKPKPKPKAKTKAVSSPTGGAAAAGSKPAAQTKSQTKAKGAGGSAGSVGTKKAPTPKPKSKQAKLKPAYPKSSSFVRSQHQKLLELRDSLFDTVQGATRENLRSRSEGNDASAFGMHQADAGSEAYDRDFALNMLNQEQDALYEINEAIKRIEGNAYGVCEMSGEAIPRERLEYLPWARYTVQVQSKIEQEQGYGRVPRHSRSSFGFGEDDDED